MRATRYQTGNSADIPRDILKKMIFSLDNANLPMLTWRLVDGSVLQVQKTDYENVVRFWGKKVAEVCYAVSYAHIETGIQRIKILNSDMEQVKDVLWSMIPGTHFLKHLSGQEWKIGDLVYIKDAWNGYFYNTKTGKVLDYTFPGADLAVTDVSSVLVENDTLYIVRNFSDTRSGGYLIKIKPVKNNGDYTFEETIYPFLASGIQYRPVLLEEGVFYQATQVVDENYYDTVVVIDKDTGTSVVKEGFFKYIGGSGAFTRKEWFSPLTNAEYTYLYNPPPNPSHNGIVTYPYKTAPWSGFYDPTYFNGTIIEYDANHIAQSLFGKSFYTEDVNVYSVSPVQQIKTISAFDVSGVEVFPETVQPLGVIIDLSFGGFFEWKGFVDTLFRCHVTRVWGGMYETDYVMWGGNQITIEELYEKFGLSTDDHTINYMSYLPGLEKDPTIAALLR